MVNVVIVAPPSDTHSAHKVGDQEASYPVACPISSQPCMSGIMRDESDLMPEQAKWDRCQAVIDGCLGALVGVD
jgi:hypothetical protein